MSKILVEKAIPQERIDQLDIKRWPVWEKEVSCFPWTYSDQETCLLLAGKVTVTADSGESVTLQAGDLAIFPAGLSCTWDITENLRKHYHFD